LGLDSSDPIPTGISLENAYSKIRAWYVSNSSEHSNPHAQTALPLINALPPANEPTDLEIRAVLAEVVMGKLEWAYHESDGQYKMGAYAHAALDLAGHDFRFTGVEKEALRQSNSPLLPHLSEHILRD
jgi:hypothetical protein